MTRRRAYRFLIGHRVSPVYATGGGAARRRQTARYKRYDVDVTPYSRKRASDTMTNQALFGRANDVTMIVIEQ